MHYKYIIDGKESSVHDMASLTNMSVASVYAYSKELGKKTITPEDICTYKTTRFVGKTYIYEGKTMRPCEISSLIGVKNTKITSFLKYNKIKDGEDVTKLIKEHFNEKCDFCGGKIGNHKSNCFRNKGRNLKRYDYNGKSYSTAELAELAGVSYACMFYRLSKHPVEYALSM